MGSSIEWSLVFVVGDLGLLALVRGCDSGGVRVAIVDFND